MSRNLRCKLHLVAASIGEAGHSNNHSVTVLRLPPLAVFTCYLEGNVRDKVSRTHLCLSRFFFLLSCLMSLILLFGFPCTNVIIICIKSELKPGIMYQIFKKICVVFLSEVATITNIGDTTVRWRDTV